MAAKTLTCVTSILKGSAFRTQCIWFPLNKRDFHIKKLFHERKIKFPRTFKILVGCTCLAISGYLLLYRPNDKYSKKLKQLQLLKVRETFNFIADIVEEAADAVVHITVKEKGFFTQYVKGGSGFVINKNGLILTNAHVVGNEYGKIVYVTFRNGKVCMGLVKEVDEVTDLALIDINEKLPVPLALGTATDLRPGEWVAAIGSPLYLSNSVTAGVVSSVVRRSTELGFNDKNMNYIQTDATIVGGNSGGPLINLDGKVIGINTMTLTSGISFAIPVEYVKEFLDRYYKSGETGKGKFYIGMSYLPLNSSTLPQLQASGVNLPSHIKNGLYVWNVTPGLPAYRCGIQKGDVIFEVEGKPVYDVKCLYEKFKMKDTINIKLFRNGLHYKTELTYVKT